MKKCFLILPFLCLSSCIVVDDGFFRSSPLKNTSWQGVSGNPYSVSFSSDGRTARLRFSYNLELLATYQYDVDFKGTAASLYRIDPYQGHSSDYYAFYSWGSNLYGNSRPNPFPDFTYRYPELVATYY